MTLLTQEQVIEYLHKDYYNLEAILIGCVSGKVSEWPMMKPELIKLVSENAELHLVVDALTLQRQQDALDGQTTVEELQRRLAAVSQERDDLVLAHEQDIAVLKQEVKSWKGHHGSVVRSKREGAENMKAHYQKEVAALQARLQAVEEALKDARRSALEEAVQIALHEEEPEGQPSHYIRLAMDKAGVVANVLAAVRATKKGIAGAIREAALRGQQEG